MSAHAVDWVSALGGGVVGAVGLIVVGLINRKPALDAAVNAQVELVFAQYRQTITDLRSEVAQLKQEVHKLNEELSRRSTPLGL